MIQEIMTGWHLVPSWVRKVVLACIAITLSVVVGCTIAAYAIELTPTPEPGSIPPLPTMTSPFEPMTRYYIPAAFGGVPCDDRAWGDLCGGMR